MTDSKLSLVRKRRADFRDKDEEEDNDEVKRLSPVSSPTSAADGPVSAAAKRRAASEGKSYKKMTPGEQKSYLYTEVTAALRDSKHYLRKDSEDGMAAQRTLVREANAASAKKLVEAERKNDSATTKKIKQQINDRNAALRELERRHQSRVNRKYLEDMLHKMLMQDERNTKRMKTAAEEEDAVTDDDSDTDNDDEDEKSDQDRTDTESDPDGDPDSGDDDDEDGDKKMDADGDVDMKTDRKPISKGVQLKLSDHKQIDVLAYCEDGLDVAAKAVRVGMHTVVEAARAIWNLPELGRSPVPDVEIPTSVNDPVRIRTANGAFGPALTATDFKIARKTQDIIIEMVSGLNEFVTPGLGDRTVLDDVQPPFLALHAMYILMDNANERMKLAEDPEGMGRIEALLFSRRLSILRIEFATHAPSLISNLTRSSVSGQIVQIHDLVLQYLYPQFTDYYAVSSGTKPGDLMISEHMDLSKCEEEISEECKKRSRDTPRPRDDPIVWQETILPARLKEEFRGHCHELGAILKLPLAQLTKQFLTDRRNSALSALKDIQFRRDYLSREVLRMIEVKEKMIQRKGLCPPDKEGDDVEMKDAAATGSDSHDHLVGCAVIIEALEKLAQDVTSNPKKPFEGFSESDVKLLQTAIPIRFVEALARLLKVSDFATLLPTGSTDGAGQLTSTTIKFYEPTVLYEDEAKRHDEALKRADAEETALYKKERKQLAGKAKLLNDKEQKAQMKAALKARAARREKQSEIVSMIVDD